MKHILQSIYSYRVCCIFVIVILFTGCGLIPIPHPRTLPGQVTSIEVLDSETEHPVLQAEVLCSYEKFKNWLPAFPPRIRNEFRDNPAHLLPLSPQSDGVFRVQEKVVTAYIRPFGLTPLGTTIFEDYTVTIGVKAPNYLPCALTYYPHEAPVGLHQWENGTMTDLSNEGRLRVYLDKSTAIPITSIEIIDQLTEEQIPCANVLYMAKKLSAWGNAVPLYVTNEVHDLRSYRVLLLSPARWQFSTGIGAHLSSPDSH